MRGIDGRYAYTIILFSSSKISLLVTCSFRCLPVIPPLSLSLLSFFLSFFPPSVHVTAVPRARVGRRWQSPSFPREIGGEFSQGWFTTDAGYPDTDHRAAIVAQSADTQERETDARSPR